MREYVFHRTIKAAKEKPKHLLWMVLLDVGFIAIFLLLYFIAASLIPTDPGFLSTLQQDASLLIVMILLVIAYLLINLAVYSFVKFIILGKIKSLTRPHVHDFSMLKNMFLLNIIIFFLFFILVILFNIVLGLLVNQSVWLFAVAIVIFFVIAVMAYAFYNFTHSAFILNKTLKEVFAHAWKSVFAKYYLGVILFDIGAIIVYALLYVIVGLVFKDFITANYNTYVTVSGIITIIVMYILFFYNRLHFYFLTEHRLEKK